MPLIGFTKNEINNGGNFMMLCGAPGAGKTTFAKQFYEDHVTDATDWHIVSSDEIRDSLKKTSLTFGNNEVFKVVRNKIAEYISAGDNVILDSTNIYSHFRKGVVNTVRRADPDSTILCLVFATSLTECLRNSSDQSSDCYVPEDVIERMYVSLKMDEPTLNEGFDAIARYYPRFQ